MGTSELSRQFFPLLAARQVANFLISGDKLSLSSNLNSDATYSQIRPPAASTPHMRHGLLGPYPVKIPRATPKLTAAAAANIRDLLEPTLHSGRGMCNHQTALLRGDGDVLNQLCHGPGKPVHAGVLFARVPDTGVPDVGVDEARMHAVRDDAAVYWVRGHAPLEFGEPYLEIQLVGVVCA